MREQNQKNRHSPEAVEWFNVRHISLNKSKDYLHLQKDRNYKTVIVLSIDLQFKSIKYLNIFLYKKEYVFTEISSGSDKYY